ncbi:MAG: fumarylacetoacetate hydrolase family protein, partial [Chloroflexota bacterium]|nr:fumarylacetoacetate hydrolase family protein [Chloroflexota bacterium]
ELMAGGDDALARVSRALEAPAASRALSEVRLLAPIPRPRRNVMCVGWNYAEHFEEGQGRRGPGGSDEMPEYPAFFTKLPTCVVGPDEGVQLDPRISTKLDWEVELAVVIGRQGRDIPQERALEHVFGYTIANDVSVRDVQRRHGGQWFCGKSMDTHCPLGPWIATKDEIPDPQQLRLTCKVNGELKQDSNTSYMVFQIPRLIEELSLGTTLLPGDVILTGTPSGVGFARNPPEYLRVGDVMELSIERIGVLHNPVLEYTR